MARAPWWWQATCSISATLSRPTCRAPSKPTLTCGTRLAVFAAGAGHTVIVLPGRRDAWLAWSPSSIEALRDCTGAGTARALVVEMSTAAGTRSVRIEPTERAHPFPGTAPPGNGVPGSGPGPAQPGRQRLADVVPGVWRGSTSGWLAGMGELDDQAAASRFVASRLVYRQFGRRAWLLALPVVVALLARLPVTLLRPARDFSGPLLATAFGAAVLELLVLTALAAVSMRQVWLAFSGKGGGPRDLNEGARAAARELCGGGFVGLITGLPAGRNWLAWGTAFMPTPAVAPTP